MKIIEYPETRQTFNFDCGANALVSALVFAGIEEREDRVALLAGTTKSGTNTRGVLRVLRYHGLPLKAGKRMTPSDLRLAVDEGFPTLLTLQAYRESNRPYRTLWDDGHWVVAIGYDQDRIFFEDPSSFCRTWLADEELRQRWHDVDRGRRIYGWGCTVCVNSRYRHDRQAHMD
jgi:ABC-type bacteriocin/lantibiotic exporter with double-glycine peptidase domain